MENRILNVAFYLFTPLSDPAPWKAEILAQLNPLGIKGTILLAHEGINGFLAGEERDVRETMSRLRSMPPFLRIEAKESFSSAIPFDRLAVKLKKEIVTFRQGSANKPAPRISSEELAKLYESGEDFFILDTRNDYEVKIGAFKGAQFLDIHHFVEFAEAAKKLPEEWKNKKVVTYCTGGIRCEKAAPFLADLGFSNVFQLDGGILKYFETVGKKNWNGECFVFDERVALDENLQATGARLCPLCQGPIPKIEPHCIHCQS